MNSTIRQPKSFSCGLLSLVLLGGFVSAYPAAAQGTAFTYQGRAVFQGYSANGYYDLTFGLFDSATGGTQIGSTITDTAVAVTNGLFTVTLDFGAGSFPGADRWLELSVRTNGVGSFTTLSPRQQLTPAPYAVTAAGFTGTVQDSQLSANVALLNGNQTFSGANIFRSGNTFAGDGSGLTSLNASQLTSGTVADARLSANIPLLNGSPTFTSPVQATVGGVNYFMVPQGAIILWSGSVANIPSGWALCDGTSGTPNLTNQFVVGAGDTTKGALYAVGATGGAASHTHAAGSFGTAANTTGSESSHTHGPGSFATATGSTGTGTTGTGTTGTGTTGNESGHTHSVPGLGGGNLQFSRQVDFGSSGSSGGPWIISVYSGTSTSPKFTPAWAGSTGTGTTGGGSAHSHSIPGLSVPGLSVPALSIPSLSVNAGTSGAGSAHAHTIPAMSVTGTSASASSLPPYYALCYIMKL